MLLPSYELGLLYICMCFGMYMSDAVVLQCGTYIYLSVIHIYTSVWYFSVVKVYRYALCIGMG